MFPSAPIRLSRMATGLSALALLLAGPAAFAQATADIQVPFNRLTATLHTLGGIAVAPSGTVAPNGTVLNGTVYVVEASYEGGDGHVVEFVPSAAGTIGGTAGGTASLNTTTVGNLSNPPDHPSAVAVDSLGDLYVADYENTSLYEMAPGATTFTRLTNYAGSAPTALATDSSNDLYVADSGGHIYEFAGNTTGPVANATPATLAIGSGYTPVGLAVNSAGDVLFASAAQNHIYEYVPGGTSSNEYLASPTATGAFHFSTTVTNTPGLPIGMGFDPAGRLFVLDSYTTGGGTNHAFLWQIAATPSESTTYQVPFSAATTLAGSLAVSSVGNLYISDDSSATGAVDELFYNNNPANLGTVVAGTDAPLLNMNFDIYSADAPITEYQTMTGDYTGEFTLPTYTGTCNGEVGICNLQVETKYQSSTPGLRNGVIGYIDDDIPANVFAVHIVGNSGASSVALYPGTQTKMSTTVYEPQGEAVTGNGNTFFLADEGGINLNSPSPTYPNPALDVFATSTDIPSGSPSTVGTASELPSPMAAAVDAFGNLYVSDYSGVVYEFPPTYNRSTGATSWSGLGTKLTFPAGVALTHPMSLAVDIYNNLYIGDMGSGGVNATQTDPGYIVKVPGNGGPATELKYVIGGVPVVFPSGLIADSYGNLFIADTGDDITNFGSVDVVAASTGKATTLSITGNNLSPNTLNEPDYVALDAANDLYILDSYNERILTAPLTYSSSFVPSINNTGQIALLGALNSSEAAASVNSGLSALTTPTSLVIWPNQNTLTVSDIGYQPAGGGGNSFVPVQVFTLSAQDASATISTLGDSASLVGINVGSEPITFGTPTSNNNTYSLATGCGNGDTLDSGVTSACTATVDSATSPGGDGTITLSSENTISVTGPISTTPIATLTPASENVRGLTEIATLTNTGGGTLDVTSISAGANGSIVGESGTCNDLTTTDTCTITYTFTPFTGTFCFFICFNYTYYNPVTIEVVTSNGGDAAETYTYEEFGGFAVPAGGAATPDSRGVTGSTRGGGNSFNPLGFSF